MTTFREIGPKLAAAGFEVFPVEGKRPTIDGWQDMPITPERVGKWAANGKGDMNVGLRMGTGRFPLCAVDIDIFDAEVSHAVRESAEARFGKTLIRVGRAPKCMLLYRMARPFSKKQTARYWDGVLTEENGKKIGQKIEVLGRGQQAVIYGTHPETGRPFEWVGGKDLGYLFDPDELPAVTEEAISAWVLDAEKMLPPAWEKLGSAVAGAGSGGLRASRGSEVDAFEREDLRDPDVTIEMARDWVLRLGPEWYEAGTRDAWVRVGMALHTQFEGTEQEDEALALWQEFSEQGPAQDGECEAQWASFVAAPGAVTIGTIKQAPEVRASAVAEVAAQRIEREGWDERISEAANVAALRTLCVELGAVKRELGPMETERLCQAIKAQSAAIGERMGIAAVRAEVASGERAAAATRSGVLVFPDSPSEDGGSPPDTLSNVGAILDHHDMRCRYNVITKKVEVMVPGLISSVDNKDQSAFSHVVSACRAVGMGTKHIKGYLIAISDQHLHNPAADWITSKPWDGVPRIQALCDTVTSPMDKAVKDTFIVRWLTGACRAAVDPDGVKGAGVLTLQGGQGKGKSRWFAALAPRDLVLPEASINPHDKDSVLVALGHWIVELAELDTTFNKSDLGALKSFLGRDTDKIRRAYAEVESEFARRSVFGATVNDDEFLRDRTGNRRYWTIPIESIDPDHGMDMQQVWAEVLETLVDRNAPHYLSGDELAVLNAHNEAFVEVDPVEEVLSAKIDWAGLTDDNGEWVTASTVYERVFGRTPNRYEARAAALAIKRLNGGKRRRTSTQKLLWAPKVTDF